MEEGRQAGVSWRHQEENVRDDTGGPTGTRTFLGIDVRGTDRKSRRENREAGEHHRQEERRQIVRKRGVRSTLRGRNDFGFYELLVAATFSASWGNLRTRMVGLMSWCSTTCVPELGDLVQGADGRASFMGPILHSGGVILCRAPPIDNSEALAYVLGPHSLCHGRRRSGARLRRSGLPVAQPEGNILRNVPPIDDSDARAYVCIRNSLPYHVAPYWIACHSARLGRSGRSCSRIGTTYRFVHVIEVTHWSRVSCCERRRKFRMTHLTGWRAIRFGVGWKDER
jgi:hypothetical protein